MACRAGEEHCTPGRASLAVSCRYAARVLRSALPSMSTPATASMLARQAIKLFDFLSDCSIGAAMNGDRAASDRYSRLADLALKRYERRYRKATAAAEQS